MTGKGERGRNFGFSIADFGLRVVEGERFGEQPLQKMNSACACLRQAEKADEEVRDLWWWRR